DRFSLCQQSGHGFSRADWRHTEDQGFSPRDIRNVNIFKPVAAAGVVEKWKAHFSFPPFP
ncbi:MAG TPA: hypothetical protein VE291_01110, partial [Terracidiphilus sp.]|nr:hypothetical protein [Terracidiphilus sp.]